ncbi:MULTISPECIES: hypothetical protein [Methylophaga]|jgi:DNA-binding NarL/FixJ family response regulator|uniref:Response regulator transcription factor n=1 Tax=Methylophaga marina TaxID=45495 RepID=A0ABN0TRZ9_9GAMM|nr:MULTISPECIES: hypothetical protein [Methylophaga]MAX52935.1 hypothetical protein [Methylophaga sp.]BDZ73396.1 hypothetical protein GCM10025856_11150 [Methylophaga marina]|tara:strand:- start:3560 stop:4000 length:441 start_codon:yes stop_codon:yes gene_type:complete
MINVCLVGSDIKKELALLQSQHNITTNALYDSSFEILLEAIAKSKPDVLVISDRTDELSADELCFYVNLRSPHTKTIIITDKPATYEQLKLSAFTCRGFVAYEQRHAIVRAVRVVHDGEAWIPRKLVTDVLDHLAKEEKRQNLIKS